MLYWMCERSGDPLSWPQLKHAICRNFGGLESEGIKPLEVFSEKIDFINRTQDFSLLDDKVLPLT